MMEKKFGILIGRFQPFHLGHGAIVEEIVADGLIPIIIIGSADKQGTAKNPLSSIDRAEIIRHFGLHPLFSFDNDNWNEWWNDIWDELDLQGVNLDECIFYINEKPQDKTCNYIIRSKNYVDAHYTDFLKDIGVDTKYVTYPKLLGIAISATDIRADLEGCKHFLHGSTYRYIKENNISLKGDANG
jgi:nicotinic acid mononucleotide adenylyltransferase